MLIVYLVVSPSGWSDIATQMTFMADSTLVSGEIETAHSTTKSFQGMLDVRHPAEKNN